MTSEQRQAVRTLPDDGRLIGPRPYGAICWAAGGRLFEINSEGRILPTELRPSDGPRKLGLHQDPVLDARVELIGASRTEPVPATLPGHEDGEPAKPWEDAAREQLQRIAAAMRRLDHLDLPTPGAADRLDVIELEPLARAIERAADRYESFREARRDRLADERRART